MTESEIDELANKLRINCDIEEKINSKIKLLQLEVKNISKENKKLNNILSQELIKKDFLLRSLC